MPINPAFKTVLAADADTRSGLFAATAARMGTSARNAEKDFWVCLALDILFNGLEPGGPRLLFKGGTSLSKAFGLIARFSEDIDVTVFRDDLGQPGSMEELAALSRRQRDFRLDAIREACSAYISGPLHEALSAAFSELMSETGHVAVVVVDFEDETRQSLQIQYSSVTGDGDAYIKPIVRLESGAKSALDPHAPQVIRPYVEADLPDIDFAIPGVITVDPRRTLWDKIAILHGLRRWYENRHVLRQEGQRISRHYYDVHRLMQSEIGEAANDLALGEDCVLHARMFFDRPDYNLDLAKPGTFELMPRGDMVDRLKKDYDAMLGMIFGPAPDFNDVLASVAALEARLNAEPAPAH